MKFPSGLLVFGFGGHARAVADVAIASGIKNIIFYDKNAKAGENFANYPVLGTLPEIGGEWACMPASGDGAIRKKQVGEAESRGWRIATLVAPSATIGIGAEISMGSFIGHQAHIGPSALIGEACIINSGAIVEHEVRVGDYVHVSVNATVAGRSRLGNRVIVGAGATVIDSINVCDDAIIGAGAVVIRSIDCPGVYVGMPARTKAV